jgi:ubiquinone/menaquinone biosynthesis C-methylase UbiE
VLIEAAGVTSGQGLLDVAAGDGNLALAAVGAGARVTALDLGPRLVERGRERRCPGRVSVP